MTSSSEEDAMDTGADLADDLFGSEDGGTSEKGRELSDRELDSGDDEDRDDRVREKRESEEVDRTSGKDARILDGKLWRHIWPKPFDGEVRANWTHQR